MVRAVASPRAAPPLRTRRESLATTRPRGRRRDRSTIPTTARADNRSTNRLIPVTVPTASSTAATSSRNSPARHSRSRNRSTSSTRRSRIALSAADGAIRHDPSAVEFDHAVATIGQPVVVRDQHQRRAVRVVQLEQQVDDARAGHRVEVAGGLVGEQHFRTRRERARDGDALLLAAGQLARIVARPLREADPAPTIPARRAADPASPLNSPGSITFSSAVRLPSS